MSGILTFGGCTDTWVEAESCLAVFLCLPGSTPVDSTPPRPVLAWTTRGQHLTRAAEGGKQYRLAQCEMRCRVHL